MRDHERGADHVLRGGEERGCAARGHRARRHGRRRRPLCLTGQLRPLAITLAVWALLVLAVGVGLYLKTGPQVAQLAELLARDAAAFYAAEGPRMAIVQRNFVILELAWLAAIAGSAPVAVAWKGNPTVCGIALGLLINTALLLAFDIVAERRGGAYFTALGAAPSAAP